MPLRTKLNFADFENEVGYLKTFIFFQRYIAQYIQACMHVMQLKKFDVLNSGQDAALYKKQDIFLRTFASR